MSGEADLFHPVMYDNLTRVDLPPDPNYYASTDLTDKAIGWVHSQHSLAPASRFSSTTPRSATTPRSRSPRSGATSTRANSTRAGTRFGRKRWPARSSWGSCPPTPLAPKPEGIQDWDHLTADEKVFARYMEIYAAFGEVTDYEIGRLTLAPARAWGFHDRGLLREGLAADLNVIDPYRVAPAMPTVVNDLPAGEKRIEQRSVGFLATIVGGQVLIDNGHPTEQRPGRLLRGPLAHR